MNVEWRPLTDDDLPSLQALIGRVLAVDGGLPHAARADFLRPRFGRGIVAVADGTIVATAGYTVDRGGTGAVDPEWRGQGLGTHLLGWLAEEAGDALVVSTESLTDEADALFRRHGLRRTNSDQIMRIDLRAGEPSAPLVAELTEWSDAASTRFFACYEASFRDRPGFPGWTERQWVDWVSEDLDPQWTLLASRAGEDVGFVVGADDEESGWITQVGVVPAGRGTGLGAGLTAEAVRRMRSAGRESALLDVNDNNPGAARVYERLGFTRIGRRGRYAR